MRRKRKARPQPGLAPGTLVHVGERKIETIRITVFQYNQEQLVEREIEGLQELPGILDSGSVTWINLWGIHDTDMIAEVGRRFDLHPLLLEDILNTDQRPKMDEYENCLFLTLKMLTAQETPLRVEAEQVSFVLGSNWVLSFQERVGDVFDPVRGRIRGGKGRIRSRGADYLLYCLLDSVIDHYFLVLERFGDGLAQLEEQVFESPESATLRETQRIKTELLQVRRTIWPVRELVAALLREETSLIQESTLPFLRDVYDHAIQVFEMVESFRDVSASLLDVYLSTVSNRMNEVMKILTIMASIFIPLTFIAGIYGMNFEYMPELQTRWAYPIIWFVMILLAGGMLVFFRRKRWL